MAYEKQFWERPNHASSEEERLEREIIKLKAQRIELSDALKGMIIIAEYGVDVCANNSRQEEREGHKDSLLAMIDNARKALAKAKGV